MSFLQDQYAMAKKKKRLIDQIKELPTLRDGVTGTAPWHFRMQQDEPEKWEEFCEIIDSWNSGGVAREKFTTGFSLHRFLAGKDKDRPLDPPLLSISYSQFRHWFRDNCR